MIYNRIYRFAFVSSFSFLFLLNVNARSVLGKPDLKIKGKVIAYKFTSQIGNASTLGYTNTLLVRISKIHKGKEQSEFIIVRFMGNYKEYVAAKFDAGETFNFRLNREQGCDETFEELANFSIRDDEGNVVKIVPALTFVPNINKELISSKTSLPCYFISPD